MQTILFIGGVMMQSLALKPELELKQLNLFRQKLPKKPYSTDFLHNGLQIRSVKTAMKRRYIQPNNPNSKLWLAHDIDRPTSPDELIHDRGLPPPNLFIQNPENQHAHVLYSLERPVHMNASSSKKAIKFCELINHGLLVAMDSDPGYSGLMIKNPLNPNWKTSTHSNESYSLEELADYVSLDGLSDRCKPKGFEAGRGRNVNLFDRVRHWSYREFNKGQWQSFNAWCAAVESKAFYYNSDEYFSEESKRGVLPKSEVRATAKSIAKWIWNTFDEHEFSSIQAARGRKSGQSRREKAEFKRKRAIQLLNDGYTQAETARMLGMSRARVNQWLKGVK